MLESINAPKAQLASNCSEMAGGGPIRLAKIPPRLFYLVLLVLFIIIVILLLPRKYSSTSNPSDTPGPKSNEIEVFSYNPTYPLTRPVLVDGVMHYRIGVVADQDLNSKEPGADYTWFSILKKGTLKHKLSTNTYSVEWDKELRLKTHLSEKGRGAELSELIVFNGKLLTVDDRSGIVFEIRGTDLVPWVKLNDGPGSTVKGFKSEWMAVKGHRLFVGGLGKEWTSTTGAFVNDHPQYIKKISPIGHVTHHPWATRYNDMKKAVGIKSPGYIIHESACWSDIQKKWFFLPRRASNQRYNDVDDEHRATDLMITANEDFSNIQSSRVTNLNQYRGFSSFKFIPGTKDSIILALKSEENKDKIVTYILVFDLAGRVLMDETIIGKLKFEGVEFI